MQSENAIDYDRTAAEYEASLVTKLRGHGAGSFLENWVPDPDPVLGIFNMVEAAWTAERHELDLLVSRATLDDGTLRRLVEFAKAVAEFSVEKTDTAYRLRATRIRNGAATGTKVRGSGGRAQPIRAAAKGVRFVTRDIHPDFASALQAETTAFTREGAAADVEGCTRVTAAVDGAAIELLVKQDIICSARHSGVRPDVRRRLAELMCRLVEGRSVQDASDHAGVLALQRLQARAGKRPAEGVLLPANAGTEVVAALGLIRNACSRFLATCAKPGAANFFDPGPGVAWKALPFEEKLQRIVSATEAFCTSAGWTPTAIKAVRLDKDIQGHQSRVIVQMDGQIEPERVPLSLRRLEAHLKSKLEAALQVYLEPVKDKNVLRRL